MLFWSFDDPPARVYDGLKFRSVPGEGGRVGVVVGYVVIFSVDYDYSRFPGG